MARAVFVASLVTLALIAGPPRASATMPTPLGTIAPEVRGAFEAGLFALPPRPVLEGSAATSVQPEWNIPVLMISFSDDTLDYSSAGFDSALFDTTGSTPTGSVYDYYRWVSGDRLRVRGRVVARVQLSERRSFYGANGFGLDPRGNPQNIYGAIFEALTASHESVDWAPFDVDRDGYVDMLWVVHAGTAGEMSGDRNDFWSITSRMSGGWRNGGAFVTRQYVPGAGNLLFRIDRFSTMPELSILEPGGRIEIGVFCHEFGHALGLPDLYDTSSLQSIANVGPGNWSLMSTGGYGGNGSSPESPSHMGGWSSVLLGWREIVRPSRDTTITLRPLSSGGEVIEVWPYGRSNPEHFLLECRNRESFDGSLNIGGMIVTQVDEAAIGARIGSNRVNAGLTPGLWIVEADADSDLVVGRNRGDAFDPFPGLNAVRTFDEASVPAARTFEGGPSGIALRNIQRIGTDVRFDLEVRPPGWLPATDITRGSYQPVHSLGLAPTAALDELGNIYRVQSEVVAGRSQVVLRTRVGGTWLDPQVLSSSPVGAVDPCLALLGNHDLAVAWSDLRGGRARVWYRARVNGAWGQESLIGDLPGENRAPAIGADRQGRVHLAWLNTLDDFPAVAFTRFLYFAPWGVTTRITDAASWPGAPVIAVSRSGTSHIIWPERGTAPFRLLFSRFHPDSGVTHPAGLTPTPPGSQGPVAAFADSAGTLHVVWASTNMSAREIHYQRRPLTGPPAPPDTTIDVRGEVFESLTLNSDPSGTLHLAYVAAPGALPQMFYKRWRPGFGWDVSVTEVSSPAEGDAVSPSLLPSRPGTVTAIYASTAGEPRLMERLRQLEPPIPVLAAGGEPPARPHHLEAGPNPLRPGQGLELRWEARSDERVIELFDVAGRRVASATAAVSGTSRIARVGGETTLRFRSGVYFARPRGWNEGGARLVVLR